MLTKEQKARLRAVYAADIWPDNDHMTDFCVGKTAVLAELPNGDFIPIDKQSIEKHFCFGESGYDYEDAQKAAAHARTSEDYFRSENMKAFDEWLKDIDEQYVLYDAENPSLPDNVMCISEKPYCSMDRPSALKGLRFFLWNKIIMGGSVCLRDFPGASITVDGYPYRVPTRAELDVIRAAFETARAEHAKKVDRYLKRYGLSQVHAWTYWRDA